MKYTINTIVGIYTANKAGQAFITKAGKPYKKATVKFTEAGDKLVSMPIWQGNPDPTVGASYEGEIKTRMYNGNEYYDFQEAKKPSKVVELEFSLANTNRKLDRVIAFLKEKFPPEGAGLTSAGTPVPTFQRNTPQQAQEFENKMNAYENKTFEAKHTAGEDDYGDIEVADIPF